MKFYDSGNQINRLITNRWKSHSFLILIKVTIVLRLLRSISMLIFLDIEAPSLKIFYTTKKTFRLHSSSNSAGDSKCG